MSVSGNDKKRAGDVSDSGGETGARGATAKGQRGAGASAAAGSAVPKARSAKRKETPEPDFDKSAWADELVDTDADEDFEGDPLSDFFVGAEEMQTMRPVGLASAAVGEEERQSKGASLDDDYLSFMLGDEEYAVPITALREIVRPLPITEVPRTPKYVLGVVTLRGTVLPVLDLRIKLGLPTEEPSRSARILVVETDDGPAGIWADQVSEVVRIGGEPLEPPPGALGGGGEYLEGIIRRDNRMLIVLNLEHSLRVETDGSARTEKAGPR
jgi:purine-binding chemotaxis protein CheW